MLGYGTLVAGELEIPCVPRRAMSGSSCCLSALISSVTEHLFASDAPELGRLWPRKNSSSTAPGSTTSRTSPSGCPGTSSICITGLSGSGKSSLAFDTIYAEGQRRYVERSRAYARQFLQMMEKPDVDSIDGL